MDNNIEKQEDYICPNCNTVATGNYCPQCGQETHLHKDTFWGMIMHFVEHYFDYDSKFWKTLKALLFCPGKLTLEYRAKHRQRYIPPISLYMFISIVFFLLFSIHNNSHSSGNTRNLTPQQQDSAAQHIRDSVNISLAKQGMDTARMISNSTPINNFIKWLKTHRKQESEEQQQLELIDSLPKVFFLMIPLFALLLKICFIRNKNYYFVDHAVFALHVHSFIFIISLLWVLNPFEQTKGIIHVLVAFLLALYFVLALRKVYGTKWLRSILTLFFVTFWYLIFLFLVYLLVVIIILIM